MKGESRLRTARERPPGREEADGIAVRALSALAGDGERLGRFLQASGLDVGTLRAAASEPGFLAAVLDHLAADEDLLVEVAREIGASPERVMAARQVLSPEADAGA